MKSENRIQQECYMWFWNTYSDLRKLLFAVPNGGARSAIEGKLFKETGVVAGVSDMIFLYKGEAYLIELKTETGTQSQLQRQWQLIVEKQGFKYYLIRNLDQFKILLKSIINE